MPVEMTNVQRDALVAALRHLNFLEVANHLARQGEDPNRALLEAFVQWRDAYPTADNTDSVKSTESGRPYIPRDGVVHRQAGFLRNACGAEWDPFSVTLRPENVTCPDCVTDDEPTSDPAPAKLDEDFTTIRGLRVARTVWENAPEPIFCHGTDDNSNCVDDPDGACKACVLWDDKSGESRYWDDAEPTSDPAPVVLADLTLSRLRAMATAYGVAGANGLNKARLIEAIERRRSLLAKPAASVTGTKPSTTSDPALTLDRVIDEADAMGLLDGEAVLYDADTAEPIGPATPEQIEASNQAAARSGTGIILISADGVPVADDTWGADQPGVRRVYTY